MKYRPRPGVVKTQICGQSVLIPTRKAFDQCNKMITLSKLFAATWDAIVTDYPLEKSVKIHMMLTRKSEEEARSRILRFQQEMVEKGYLIEVPEDEVSDSEE